VSAENTFFGGATTAAGGAAFCNVQKPQLKGSMVMMVEKRAMRQRCW
jgi:hypothetical protein